MREKLSDKIILQVKSDIQSGKYKVGEKLPSEAELMDIYRVGRSTIRESVKTLAESGILRVQQGSGTFINQSAQTETIDQRLRRADFDELNSVRILLEVEIVKLAAQNVSAQHLAKIEDCLNARKIAIMGGQMQECIDADIRFHLAIAKSSGNSVLADLYQSCTALIEDFFLKREPTGITQFAMSHHLHVNLFNAIKDQNQQQAAAIIKEILQNNY